MQNIEYKVYTKAQMLNIISRYGIIFVDTSLGDNYIIKISDIADFIMLEAIRTDHVAELTMYIPGVAEPVLTTFGCFLNRVNPQLREEIIDRLVLLQTTNTKPKNVKIFNNSVFEGLSAEEVGIENKKVKNFDKFYGKYVHAPNVHNIKMRGD